MTFHLRTLGAVWPEVAALGGLVPGASAYALAQVPLGPTLVVVPRGTDADRMLRILRFHCPAEVPCFLLPPDDVRPYDGQSPHPDPVRQRIAAVRALTGDSPCFVITCAKGVLHKVLPTTTIDQLSHTLTVGEEIDRAKLVHTLVIHGYHSTHQVVEPGCVASRGAVIDIWPVDASAPSRIELFDDEIEDVRVLDPETQKSGTSIGSVRIPPAREAVPTEEALKRAATHMGEVVERIGGGQGTRRRVIESLRDQLWFPAAEDYVAALHPLVDVWTLADRRVVIEPEEVLSKAEAFAGQLIDRWESGGMEHRSMVMPEARYGAVDTLAEALKSMKQMRLLATTGPGGVEATDFHTRDNAQLLVGSGELAPVVGQISSWLRDGWQVSLVCDSRARAERISALFEPHGLSLIPAQAGEFCRPGEVGLWVGELPTGFHSPRDRIAIITADEIFGTKTRTRHTPKALRDATLGSISELKIGELVVHSRHGVGRFEQLKRIDMDGVLNEYAEVHYRGGDRLYLPVTRLDELYRYRAVGDKQPRLDKLGGETWAKRKAKVRDRVMRMAHELLQAHAMRAVEEGHAYAGRPVEYRQFAETFPYVETPDQAAAIEEVLEDLASPQPMDRLVVGDVGFGKTEVAMRAAMRVVLEGHQVALLCPTTVLSFQHRQTLKTRFADTGVRVELLSGFVTAQERKTVLKELAEGKVDIVIGTTSLLGADLRFRRLGLVVVDEEHRFGVRQKHRIKQLVSTQDAGPVQYLAMSATPIPRTLHMALSGLRKVSLITTPPADRRAVQTRVGPFDEARIREDILEELGRGGQVFFIHNRVGSIDAMAHFLRELVPEATMGVAHGQMDKRQLERVLVDFIQRKTHVLICTAIIESGVDIPSVNTMLINRAEMLGLAQLYQLRGRVGRSHIRARCTLLLPPDRKIDRNAMLRLRALQEHTDLGAGFAISTRDMEIRGSGTLLGEAQHGHIQSVGYDTYVQLLEEAVAAARGDISRERLDPEIEVPVPTLLPESWIEPLEERISAYRSLSSAQNTEQVRRILGVLEDRYGEPPPEALNLGWAAEIRVRCRDLGIAHVRFLNVRVLLDFDPSTPVDPARIVSLVSGDGERFSLTALPHASDPDKTGRRLIVRFTPDEAKWPFRFLHWVLRQLETEQQ